MKIINRNLKTVSGGWEETECPGVFLLNRDEAEALENSGYKVSFKPMNPNVRISRSTFMKFNGRPVGQYVYNAQYHPVNRDELSLLLGRSDRELNDCDVIVDPFVD